MRIIIKIVVSPRPGLDALGGVLPLLLPVLRHGTRHCGVSFLPAGYRGVVRRTGGRFYRLPGAGVAGKPLRSSAGGLLDHGTGGGLYPHAEISLTGNI